MAKKIFSAPLLLLLLVFFGNSCKKIVTNIKLPSNPKLVVSCFISPQDTMKSVRLSYSTPLFSNNNNNTAPPPVVDATVVISNGNNSATIPVGANFNTYQLPTGAFPIIAGQTYSLSIATTKGEKVSASCRVPLSNIASLDVDRKDSTPIITTYTTRWNDIPNETNYYRLYYLITHNDSNINSSGSSFWDYNEINLFNDNKKDGKEFVIKRIYSYDVNDTTKRYFHAFVMNIDVEYYRYQYSLEHNTGYDPFSEPSPIYTNIKNGLGIFAAYQKKYKRIP